MDHGTEKCAYGTYSHIDTQTVCHTDTHILTLTHTSVGHGSGQCVCGTRTHTQIYTHTYKHTHIRGLRDWGVRLWDTDTLTLTHAYTYTSVGHGTGQCVCGTRKPAKRQLRTKFTEMLSLLPPPCHTKTLFCRSFYIIYIFFCRSFLV